MDRTLVVTVYQPSNKLKNNLLNTATDSINKRLHKQQYSRNVLEQLTNRKVFVEMFNCGVTR